MLIFIVVNVYFGFKVGLIFVMFIFVVVILMVVLCYFKGYLVEENNIV